MHTIEIPDIDYLVNIPSSVEELTPEQYRFFVRLVLRMDREALPWDQFRLLLINHFIEFQPPFKKLDPIETKEAYAQIYQMSELMDSFSEPFVDSDKNPSRRISLSFIKNPIPSFQRFKGPADALGNCTFQQFIDAHHAYSAFTSSNDVQDLNTLFACLYRYTKPRLFSSKLLYPVYSDSESELSMIHINSIPYEIKYGVFLWFHCCEQFLRDGDIPLGDTIVNLSVLYGSGESSGSLDDTGLIGVLYTIAEGGVFGNAAEVAKTNLYDVLIRIYQSIQLSKSIKK